MKLDTEKILHSFCDWFRALFLTGVADWNTAGAVEGLKRIEAHFIFHYLFKFSPVYIFREGRKTGEEWVNFTYGEVTYPVGADILRTMNVADDDVIYDLGCGRGRFLFLARLMTGATCIGVDILPTYINFAERLVEKLEIGRLHFFLEDMRDVDLSTATFVFVHGTTFSDDLHECIMNKIDTMRTGARLVSVSMNYHHPRLEPVLEKKYLMSWGRATAYFYRVK